MRQVEPQDATFLYVEGENRYAHGSLIWIYDATSAPQGLLRLDDLRRHVESRLHITPFLYQRLQRVPLDLDYPYWVNDDALDLDAHLHERHIATPGDWASLWKTVADIHAVPLSLDRPPWEMHLLHGLKLEGLPRRCFALQLKLHHVALDGASGMALVRGLHDFEATALPAQAGASGVAIGDTAGDAHGAAKRNDRAPDTLGMLTAAARNNFSYGIKGVKSFGALARRLPGVLTHLRLQSLRKSEAVPQTPFNRKISTGRSFGCAFGDLEDIRRIRHAVPGATINDVALTVCGGALRRYLEEEGALPEQSMVAVCPVNVRTADESAAGGNRVTMMTARIHTDIADPLARLKAVHQSTRHSKNVVEAIGAREIMNLNASLSSTLQKALVKTFEWLPNPPRPFNLSISNLFGPKQTLYLCGARLLRISGALAVGNGYGLFITLCSYDRTVSFSLTSTPNILPDPEVLAAHFRAELSDLTAAALARSEHVES